jgi:hypothetical protein
MVSVAMAQSAAHHASTQESKLTRHCLAQVASKIQHGLRVLRVVASKLTVPER